MNYLSRNHAENPTQESNKYFTNHGSYQMEEDSDENFIELLDNSNESGQKPVNYEGNNKYALSQHDNLYNQNRNNKTKNTLVNKTPSQIQEKPFILDGNQFKSNVLKYNPLKDDHLKGFFLNKNVRRQIKQNQLVDKEGKIIDKYHVKLNSSKDSSNNPINNIALSFQINNSNENNYQGGAENFFCENECESMNKINMNIQKEIDEANIEVLCDNNSIKQKISSRDFIQIFNKIQDQFQTYESPRFKKKDRELQLSQKQLLQKNIYQKSYLTGYSSDHQQQNSNRANLKSACGGYSKPTVFPFRRESIKCKTPDPYSKQQGIVNQPQKNKISPEKQYANKQRSITVHMEERKKILQERKLLVKKQQQQLAQQLVIQNQIRLAKQKEQYQLQLLQIQKQQEQLNQYRKQNSPQKMNENRNEKSPQNYKYINTSNTSNYLSKSPNIPTKLNTGKRTKTTVYHMTETYTQFDKQIMNNNKRCISLESQINNQKINANNYNIKNKYNENVDNKQTLQKLNQNMIQIQNLNTKSSFNRSPLTTTQKQITSKSEKKENQPISTYNSYSQKNGRLATPSTRYNQRNLSNYRSYNTKITNLDQSYTNKRSNPTIQNKIEDPFTPSKMDKSKTPKSIEKFQLNLKSRSLTLNLNDLNESKHNQRSSSQISRRNLIQDKKPLKTQEEDLRNKQVNQIEGDKLQRTDDSFRRQDNLQLTQEQFKQYMIQQVKTLQEENQKIKQNQITQIDSDSQLSKQNFDSFMKMHKQKVNSKTNTISPKRNNHEFIEEED